MNGLPGSGRENGRALSKLRPEDAMLVYSMTPPAAANVSASLLADSVLVAHLLFILFVMLGGLLVLRWAKLAWLHLPAVAWGIYVELSGRICPLTPLENSLREAAGQVGYSGGFIEHYVTALIYPDGLSRRIQMALAAIVVIVNAAVYWRLFSRRRVQATASVRRNPRP
jgi:hypothetical protein